MIRPPLMTHDARRRLIEAPLIIRTHTHSRAWGGLYIRDTIPTEGRRVHHVTSEDESYYTQFREEEE